MFKINESIPWVNNIIGNEYRFITIIHPLTSHNARIESIVKQEPFSDFVEVRYKPGNDGPSRVICVKVGGQNNYYVRMDGYRGWSDWVIRL